MYIRICKKPFFPNRSFTSKGSSGDQRDGTQKTPNPVAGQLRRNPGGRGSPFFSKKFQNPGKWPLLNRKVINLSKGKFEVSEQEIFRNALKLLQYASKCFKMLQNASKCFKMLQNSSKFFKMLQNCFKMCQNALKMLRNASKCFKMLQNSSKCFKIASKCVKML